MILDKELQYSDAQAITGTVDSTNVLDHGVSPNGLGAGEPFAVLIAIGPVTANSANVTIDIESDDLEGFGGTIVDIGTKTILAADIVEGARFYIPLEVGFNAKRYTRLEFTAGTSNFVCDAYLIPQSHQDEFYAFPDNADIVN